MPPGGNNVVMMVRVAANLSELRSNLAQGEASIRKTSAAMNKMVASFQGEKLTLKASNMTAAIAKLGGATKLTDAEQKRVNKTLTAAIAKYQQLGQTAPASMRELERATRAATKPMLTLSQRTQLLGRRVEAFGMNAQAAGMTLSRGLTAPIVAVAAVSAKAAIDFESSFAGVRKTVDATEQEFQQFAAAFRAMSTEIPINVNEINRIGEAAGQLGIRNENIVGFTRVMADLGVATNLSSDQAATALARLANITQMPQDQFDRLGSTVVDLGNNMATTESEIVAFGLRLAGAGAQVGLTEAEILSFGAALSSVGINAEAGGTAISKVMINIASAVANGGEALDQFAAVAEMTTAQFSEQFRTDAAGAITAFVTGLGRMEEKGGSTLQVLEEMGIKEQRMRDALLRAAGAGDLLTEAIDIGTAAWEENLALTTEAEQRYKTTASQLVVVKNRVQDAAIELGQAFLPIISDVIDEMDPLIDRLKDAATEFRELPPETQRSRLTMLAFAAGLGPVLSAMGFMVLGIKQLSFLFTGPIGLVVGTIAATTAMISFGSSLEGADSWLTRFLGTALRVITPFGMIHKSLDVLGNRFGNLELPAVNAAAAIDGMIPSVDRSTEAMARMKAEIDRAGRGAQEFAHPTLEELGAVIVETAAKTKLTAEEVKKFTAEQKKAAEATAKIRKALLDTPIIEFSEELDRLARLGYRPVTVSAIAFKAATEAVQESLKQANLRFANSREEIAAYSGRLLDAKGDIIAVGNATQQWEDMNVRLAASLPQVEAAATTAWGGIKAGLHSVLLTIPDTIVQAFTGGGDIMGAVKAIATQVGSTIGGGIGFAVGGPLGKAIGSAIGSLLGPLVGKIKEIFSKPEWKEVGKDIGRDLGVSISDALAKSIADDSKRLGDRVAAIAVNLAAVIQEVGGIEAFGGLEKAITQTRILFSAIERGQLSTAEAASALQEIFPLLSDAIDKTTGVARADFLELIALAKRFGVETAAVAEFMAGQLNDVTSGLQTFVENATVKTAAGAKALGASVVTVFAEVLQAGGSIADAVQRVTPIIDRLRDQFEETGFTGGAAFDKIARLAAIASDEVNSKALTAVDGLSRAMVGLFNMGVKDQEMFQGLATEVRATFDQLIAQGVDGNSALALMQPTLQRLWQLQDQFGLQVDDSTQAMIDQAIEAGVVGEAHRSANEKIVAALDLVIGRFDLLLQGMGIDVPLAADKMGTTAEFALNKARQAAQEAGAAVGGIGTEAGFAGRAIGDMVDNAGKDLDTLREKAERAAGQSPTGIELITFRAREAMHAVTDFARVGDRAMASFRSAAEGAFGVLNTSGGLGRTIRTLTEELAILTTNKEGGEVLKLLFDQQHAIDALGPIPSEYRATYEAARAEAVEEFDKMLADAEERRDDEIDRLGPIPDVYDEAYEKARNRIERRYNEMIADAEDRRDQEFDRLGEVPDEYERLYNRARELVRAKYEIMLADLRERIAKELEEGQTLQDVLNDIYGAGEEARFQLVKLGTDGRIALYDRELQKIIAIYDALAGIDPSALPGIGDLPPFNPGPEAPAPPPEPGPETGRRLAAFMALLNSVGLTPASVEGNPLFEEAVRILETGAFASISSALQSALMQYGLFGSFAALSAVPLAEGGIVTEPTLAQIGEKRIPELVLPVHQLPDMIKRIEGGRSPLSAPRVIHVHVDLDSRQIAEVVVPEIPGVLSDFGVT